MHNLTTVAGVVADIMEKMSEREKATVLPPEIRTPL